ncbi:MAG: hypothetical protein OQJ89_09315 [Kangiellaceae bacterium]|nr:hypothetical protein [Kangiellaceae bacterium]MCW8998242.1 hypothetical protein [Kangiellaceae bacterium]MCW9017151.1 hypothetical protein [Kangiellaceae bacterium]
MKITPEELFIENMAGRFPESSKNYIPKEEAYEKRKRFTGKDFGYDVDKWRQWLEQKIKGKLFQTVSCTPLGSLCIIN